MPQLLRLVRLGPVTGTVNPISIEDVRSFIRMSDPGEDAVIAALMETAIARVEDTANIALRKFSFRAVFTAWGLSEVIALPRPPLVSVDSVTLLDGAGNTTITGWVASPFLWPGTLSPPPGGWPAYETGKALQVDFTAGPSNVYADVPQQAKDAILLLVANCFLGREAVSFDNAAEGFMAQLDWSGLPK